MKIRPSIYLFCGAIILLIVLILWFAKRPARAPLETQLPPPIKTSVPIAVNKPIPANTAPATTPHITTQTINPAAQQEREEKYEKFVAGHNQPLIFYGKLEDQFGNPVVGAEIEGGPELAQGQTNVFTTSDNNGLFTLNAGVGWALGIMPTKQGYALATKNNSFNYAQEYGDHITPDPNNPIVIKMWKLQGAQRLIHFDIQAYVPINGSPAAFDLQTGQRVDSGGDIVITDDSPSDTRAGRAYDWKASIKAQDGGLALSEDAYDQMFQAPDGGYEPEILFDYAKDTSPWLNNIKNVYYFTSRDGRIYGKVQVQLFTYVVRNAGVYVELTGYLNPTGSKNLEVDPKFVTAAHP